MSSESLKRRPLSSSRAYKRLMKGYYLLARYVPAVWITSGGPVELVHAFRLLPFYPENHGALCGATRHALALCQLAEKEGYSPDLCSYARIDLGFNLIGQGPVGRLPRPRLLLGSNNICSTVVKWYQILAREHQTPFFLLDTPFVRAAPTDHALRYVAEQMAELAAWLAHHTGRAYSLRRLKKVALKSAEAVELWGRALKLNRHRPAPWDTFDAFIHMAPIVTLRGTGWAVRYYRKLLKELESRVLKGGEPPEPIRLVWDNIPIWHQMRNLSQFLAQRGARLVADTYTAAWTLDNLDPGEPIPSLAKAYLEVHLNLGLERKAATLARLVEEYEADGFIMHSNRSCKPYSLGQYDIKKEVTRLTGRPGLILEADHTDPRHWDETRVFGHLEAFLETLV